MSNGKAIGKNDLFFLGLVKSGYIEVRPDGGIFRNGKAIGTRNNLNGYHRIMLKVDGENHYTVAHRLVYLVYRGLIPEGYVVDHKNENPTDNHMDNLEAVTNAENIRRARLRNGGRRPRLTASERNVIVELYELGIRRNVLMQMFDVSATNIRTITGRSDFRQVQGGNPEAFVLAA